MATIKVVGNALVIESKVPFSDLEKVSRYRPEAMVLREDDRIVYSLETKHHWEGQNSIGKDHAILCQSFGDKATHTQLWFSADYDTAEELKSDVIEAVGKELGYINRIENQVNDVLPEIAAEAVKVSNSITIE